VVLVVAHIQHGRVVEVVTVDIVPGEEGMPHQEVVGTVLVVVDIVLVVVDIVLVVVDIVLVEVDTVDEII
jgi:hypothetical protein